MDRIVGSDQKMFGIEKSEFPDTRVRIVTNYINGLRHSEISSPMGSPMCWSRESR